MDIIILSIIGIISRLAPHLPNMTPVGAMAIFTSAKFGVKKALIVTLATMLATDLIKGLHPVMWATYGCFVLAVFLGKLLQSNARFYAIASVNIASSLIFFVVTNYAVWLLPNGMYPKTIAGLWECYIMALPFFRNSLIGDIFYAGVFFGGYALVKAITKRTASEFIK